MPKRLPAYFLKGKKDFNHFVRKQFLGSPFFIIVLLIFPVLKLIGATVEEFPGISKVFDAALLSARLGLYVALKAWLFPTVLWIFIRRNIPYFWIHLAFYTALSIVGVLVVHPWHQDALMDDVLRVGKQQIVALVLTVLVMLYFERAIRHGLGTKPGHVPVFLPVEFSDDHIATAEMLEPGISGEIQYMRAQNQYIDLITSEGTHLLRLTLGGAIEKLPEGAGLRVHRSWWVSLRALKDFTLDERQLELVGKDIRIPISRPNLAKLQTILAQPRAEG